MVLQFNPPDWLVKDYLDRKTPAQQASEGIGNALGTYAKMKSDEATKQNEALGNYIKAYEAGGPDLAAEVAKRYGLKNPPSLPAVTANMVGGTGVAGQMVNPSQPNASQIASAPPPMPEMATTPNENAAQMSMPSEHPMPTMPGPQMAQSPIIDHWDQTHGDGAPKPGIQPPSVGMPDEALLNQGSYGNKKYDRELKKTEANVKFAPKRGVTAEEILKNGFDPATQIQVNPKDTSAADRTREDKLSKAVTDYAEKIEKHPIIKKLQEQALGIHSVEDMLDLVGKGNTVASSAMGMKMARAMGEVGVITEQDVKRYVQSRKLSQAAADKVMGWVNGTPSNATQAEIKEISSYLKDRYDSDAQPIYNRYIERFARAYKMSPDDAAYQLNFHYAPNSGESTSMGGSMPQVGGTFEGGRVLKITKVQKAPKQ